VVDQQRDAEEQEESVDPGAVGIDQQNPVQTRREMFRRRIAETEQDFTQAPARRGCSAGTMELNDIRGEVRTV
jgi:hypothetical protein